MLDTGRAKSDLSRKHMYFLTHLQYQRRYVDVCFYHGGGRSGSGLSEQNCSREREREKEMCASLKCVCCELGLVAVGTLAGTIPPLLKQ